MGTRSLPAAVLAALAVAVTGPAVAAEPTVAVTAQGPTRVDSADVHDGFAFRAEQRLKVVCPAGEVHVARVQVTQTSGARSVAGSAAITCTGRPQHLTVALSLGPGSTRLPLDLGSDADLLAVLVSVAGRPGAQDSGSTELVLVGGDDGTPTFGGRRQRSRQTCSRPSGSETQTLRYSCSSGRGPAHSRGRPASPARTAPVPTPGRGPDRPPRVSAPAARAAGWGCRGRSSARPAGRGRGSAQGSSRSARRGGSAGSCGSPSPRDSPGARRSRRTSRHWSGTPSGTCGR